MAGPRACARGERELVFDCTCGVALAGAFGNKSQHFKPERSKAARISAYAGGFGNKGLLGGSTVCETVRNNVIAGCFGYMRFDSL